MKHLLRKYFHVTSLRRKMILSFSLLIISALAVLQSANTYQTYIILEQNLTDSVHESLRLGLSNIDYFLKISTTWHPVFCPKLKCRLLYQKKWITAVWKQNLPSARWNEPLRNILLQGLMFLRCILLIWITRFWTTLCREWPPLK